MSPTSFSFPLCILLLLLLLVVVDMITSDNDTTLIHLRVRDLPVLATVGALVVCLSYLLLRLSSTTPAHKNEAGMVSFSSLFSPSSSSASASRAADVDLTSRFLTREIPEGALQISLKMVPFCSFPPRVGACMAIDRKTHNVFVFAGEGQTGLTDDTLIFCQADNNWTWQASQGETPGHLAFASLVDLSGYLLLFGGVGKGDQLNGSVYALDLSSGDWQRCVVEGEERPKPRYGASLVRWGDGDGEEGVVSCCVLFGGMAQRSVLLDDAWLLEKTGVKVGDRPVVRWRPLLSCGGKEAIKPSPRKLHSAVVVGEEMVVLGGLTRAHLPPGVVEVLELSTGRWRREVTMGPWPSADEEEGNAANAFRIGPSKHIMYLSPLSAGIFNELFVLDTTTKPWTWARAVAEWRGDWAQVPGVRRLYAACGDVQSGDILVFGGEDSEDKRQGQLLILSAGEAVVQ